MTEQSRGPTLFPDLSHQQARAMLAFLWSAGSRGFDDEAYDATVWDWGVRPWPTMENLANKGLIEAVGWWGPEEGWQWRLTDLGRSYMESVVIGRAAA